MNQMSALNNPYGIDMSFSKYINLFCYLLDNSYQKWLKASQYVADCLFFWGVSLSFCKALIPTASLSAAILNKKSYFHEELKTHFRSLIRRFFLTAFIDFSYNALIVFFFSFLFFFFFFHAYYLPLDKSFNCQSFRIKKMFLWQPNQ